MTSEPHSTAKIRRLPCASSWIMDDFRNAFDGEDSMATVHVTVDDFRIAFDGQKRFDGYRAHVTVDRGCFAGGAARS